MGNDLDPLDEIFADETVKIARPVGKFQPRSKFRPAKKNSAVAVPPVGLDVVSNVDGGLHASTEKPATESADTFAASETFGDFHSTTNTEGAPSLSEEVVPSIPSSKDVGGSEPPVLDSVDDLAPSRSDECDHMQGGKSGKELQDMDIIDSLNMPDLPTNPGQRKEKFKPKPKKQMHHKIHEVAESISPSRGSQSVPPEIDHPEKNSDSTLHQDDMLDLSDLGFTHALPTEAASELPLNEESLDPVETTQLESGIDLDGVPKIPAKLTSRRAKTGRIKRNDAPDPTPDQQRVSASCEENGISQSRKSKRTVRNLVDEVEEEALGAAEFSDELTLEENTNDDESQLENESQTKKVKRKAQKSNDTDKPARKQRKKAVEAPKKDADAKPKKFPHSTRRRRVNKALLETPEEEIDYQKVPLRDLIMLAEHREKQTKKDEAAGLAPTAKERSNAKSSSLYNEDEEYNDVQETPEFEETLVNYHTHMEKTPRVRWSKQETELFYEAMQQFGSDLSMIQQLFPERTRHQIKLKYKKEERQHPLRLREALTGRTNDHSHYKSVIERLQKIAAEEKQNSGDDESIDLTTNGLDEGTPDADDMKNGEAKDEHIEEEMNTAAVDEPQSSLKSDNDDDDDFFKWSQYKSDI